MTDSGAIEPFVAFVARSIDATLLGMIADFEAAPRPLGDAKSS